MLRYGLTHHNILLVNVQIKWTNNLRLRWLNYDDVVARYTSL